MDVIKEFSNKFSKIDASDALFWKNVLRVDEEKVKSILESELLEKELNILLKTGYMTKIIIEILNLSVEKKEEVIKEVLEQIEKDRSITNKFYLVIYILLLLKELVSFKREAALNDVPKQFLSEDCRKISEQLNNKPIYEAALLLSEDREKLMFYYLFHKAEQSAYKQHIVIPDEENETKYEESSERLKQDVIIRDWFNNEEVQELLNQFENKNGQNRRSKLLTIHSKGKSSTLFIQRDLKREGIFEHDLTIWGNHTDILILEFINNGKVLRERSVEKKGIEIASYLIGKAYNINARFVPDSPENNAEDFQHFLTKLLSNNDQLIDFKEVIHWNFDVEGSPKVTFTAQYGRDISESILDFKEKTNIDLLQPLNHIEKIGIQFRVNNKDKFNSIIIYPKVNGNKVSILFSNNHCSRYKTNYFIIYMEEEYQLNVRPTSI